MTTSTRTMRQVQVVSQPVAKSSRLSDKVALYDADGNQLTLTAATMVLTGYVLGSAVDIAADDTVVEAFGKVQALFYNLIARVEALEAA